MAPLILNLGTRWMSVVNFITRLYQLNKRLRGLNRHSELFGGEKSFPMSGFEAKILLPVAQSLCRLRYPSTLTCYDGSNYNNAQFWETSNVQPTSSIQILFTTQPKVRYFPLQIPNMQNIIHANSYTTYALSTYPTHFMKQYMGLRTHTYSRSTFYKIGSTPPFWTKTQVAA